MLQVAHIQKKEHLITSNGISFTQIYSIDQIRSMKEGSCGDVLLLNLDTKYEALEALGKIRRNTLAGIYLKPVLINENTKIVDRTVLHFDGVFNNEQLTAAATLVKPILERINLLRDQTATNETIRLLRYVFTRDKGFKPFRSRRSKNGFVFPFLNEAYDFSLKEINELIKKIDQANYINRKREDVIQSCKSCEGSYINYRECCPKCQSIDYESDDLVHHFLCAYVGPKKDFQKNGALCCPKCDKELRHIGIDYDKPSSIYTCKRCEHTYQEPEMGTVCIDCEQTASIETLVEQKVYSFVLTPLGEELAISGQNEEMEGEVSEDQRIITPNFFKIILNQEIQRLKASGSSSVLSRIRLNQAKINLNPQSLSMLTAELQEEIFHYLQKQDMLCQFQNDTWRILFPDQQDQAVAEKMELIVNNLLKLLQDNLGLGADTLSWSLQRIDRHVELENLI